MSTVKEEDLNLDPITHQTGAHPVGTGVGSAAAAGTGAAIGAIVGGPVGFAVGGAIGAVAGGLAGHAVGEKVHPTVEEAYWRKNYSTRPYVVAGREYSTYHPAYRYGWESREKYSGKTFDEVEKDLDAGWAMRQDSSGLAWTDARPAVRDAWDRIDDQ